MNYPKVQPMTWAEIDLRALRHNFREVQRLARKNNFRIPGRPSDKSPMKILAVVKADAYGHGALRVAQTLVRAGVNYLAVSNLQEAMTLREWGIQKPILLLESTLASQAQAVVDNNLTATICTPELAEAINAYAQKKGRKVRVHIKIDTGMGRLGVWHEEAEDFIRDVDRYPNLTIEGIYTHFSSADTDPVFTLNQIKRLKQLILELDRQGFVIPLIHASNSAGLVGVKANILNLFRPGLMLYGLYPHPKFKRQVSLKPVMSVRSQVIFLKNIKKGRSVSYGRTFIAKKKMQVATIPIGYNDGYFRSFSNKAKVLINGRFCSILGRVTMDQIVVDVSKAGSVRLGTPVMILGKNQGREISADDLAALANTINYEIVCNVGNRLPRKFI